MAEAMSDKGVQDPGEDAPDTEQSAGSGPDSESERGEATAKVSAEPEPSDEDAEADDDTAERPGLTPRPAPIPRTAPRRPLGRPQVRAPAPARPAAKSPSKDDGREERPTDRLKRKKPPPDESGPRSPSPAEDESEFTDTSIDTLDQKATLPSGAPRATPPSDTPSAEPDATAATTPYQLEQHGERPAAGAARGPRIGKTADALHSEDEDGPTLIAQYPGVARPGPGRIEEATELMSLSSEPAPAPVPLAAPNMASSAPAPMTSSLPPHHPLASQFAEREAAVQAALAAATGQGRDPDALAAHRAHLFDLATVGVLGGGAVLAAALSIIAGGDAAKLNMPLAVALFLGGLVPLQRREPVKVALLSLSGVLLLVAFIAMLVI